MAFASKDIRSQKRSILILFCIHYQDDITYKTIERCSTHIKSCLFNHNSLLFVSQTNKANSQIGDWYLEPPLDHYLRVVSSHARSTELITETKKFVNCIVGIICHCDLQFAFQIHNQIKPSLCLDFTLILGQRGPERTLTWNEFANIYEYLNDFYLKLMHTLITD